MIKFKNKETALKLLSLFFAILLWFYVITEQNPLVHKDITVPVKLINVESLATYDMVLVDDLNSFSTTIRLKGKKDTLDKIDNMSITAFADLRGYKSKGDNVVPVEIRGIPQGIDIISRSGESIKVRLEPYINVQLPVTVNISGNPSQGMAALNAVSNPTDVVIRGAESLVNSVKSVVADIDIANVNGEVKKKVPIKLLNAQGKDVLNVDVNPKIVEISVPVENIKRVPIQVDLKGNPHAGYIVNGVQVFPAEIYIAGKKDIIDGITFIKTETIDIEGANASINKVVNIKLPEGIELANKTEIINVNIAIEKVVERTISTGNIELRNIPDGFEVEPFNKDISVLIKGLESDVSQAPSNMKFFIDLKDAKEGVNEISISCEKPSTLEIMEMAPVKLQVILKRKL